MKGNFISMLVNNLDFFSIFLDNLPDEINDFTLLIFNETRLEDKTKEIEKMLANSKVKRYKVFDSKFVTQKLKENVADTEFVDAYLMSMNILMLWFIFKYNKKAEKVLLLDDDDDDVVLNEGLNELFKEEKCMFAPMRLSAGSANLYDNSKPFVQSMEEWFKIAGLVLNKGTYKDYINNYRNSGQRFIVKKEFDIEHYESMLTQFFNNKFFEERWHGRRKHTTDFFDERFEVFYFWPLGLIHNKVSKYARLETSSIQRMTSNDYNNITKKPIWHNVTVSHKVNIYNEAIERGILKGNKIKTTGG